MMATMTTIATRIHIWFDIDWSPFALGTSDSGHGSGAAPTQRRAGQVNLPLPGVVAHSTYLRPPATARCPRPGARRVRGAQQISADIVSARYRHHRARRQ